MSILTNGIAQDEAKETTEGQSLINLGTLPSELLPGEKAKHLIAFQRYCLMGSERSLRSLAEALGYKASLIFKWSQAFNWADRVRYFDQSIKEEMERLTKDQIIQNNIKHLELIDSCITKFQDRLKDGKIDISYVADLEKLLNMRAKLTGESGPDEKPLNINVIFT